MKALFVANHFDRDVALRFVIVNFHDLSETALADNFQHFIPIRDVIM